MNDEQLHTLADLQVFLTGTVDVSGNTRLKRANKVVLRFS